VIGISALVSLASALLSISALQDAFSEQLHWLQSHLSAQQATVVGGLLLGLGIALFVLEVRIRGAKPKKAYAALSVLWVVAGVALIFFPLADFEPPRAQPQRFVRNDPLPVPLPSPEVVKGEGAGVGSQTASAPTDSSEATPVSDASSSEVTSSASKSSEPATVSTPPSKDPCVCPAPSVRAPAPDPQPVATPQATNESTTIAEEEVEETAQEAREESQEEAEESQEEAEEGI
jgi:hypothetical protein